MRRAVADHMGRNGHAGNNPAGQGIKREVENIVWEGVTAMFTKSAATWALGAGAAGGVARWAYDGKSSFRSFMQHVIGGMVGMSFVVSSTLFWPHILDNLAVFAAFVFLSGFLVMPILKIIFRRIETAEISFDGAGIEFHSKGEKDKQP